MLPVDYIVIFIIGYLASFIIQDQDKTKQFHPDFFISPLRNKLLKNSQSFLDITTNEEKGSTFKSLELLPVPDEIPDKK